MPLPPDLFREAPKKELEFFKPMGIWEIRSAGEAHSRMGRGPIGVQWIETNKEDDIRPIFRADWWPRGFASLGRTPYAPTAPLESSRVVLNCGAASFDGCGGIALSCGPPREERTKILCVDSSKA